MRVRTDIAWHEQFALHVYNFGFVCRRNLRRYLHNRIAVHEHIGVKKPRWIGNGTLGIFQKIPTHTFTRDGKQYHPSNSLNWQVSALIFWIYFQRHLGYIFELLSPEVRYISGSIQKIKNMSGGHNHEKSLHPCSVIGLVLYGRQDGLR